MIVEVENLGSIKKGKVELKPLTVFIGPNNTGKTYLAYLISGLCEDFLFRKYIFSPVRGKRKPVYTLSERVVSDILEKGYAEIKINLKDILAENFEYTASIFRKLSERPILVQKFVESFWKFLGGDKKEMFSNLKATVKIPNIDSRNEFEEIVYNRSGHIITHMFYEENIMLRAISFKKPKSYQMDVRLRLIERKIFSEDKQEINDAISKQIDQFLSRIILFLLMKIILQPILSNVFIFPAQRNALTLDFIKSAINIATREEIPDEDLIVSNPERLIKSKPILKFLRMVDLISEDIESEYYDIGQRLEEVLGGHLIISESKGEEEIRFIINGEKSLKLITTSSMVQQLSSLALYLKHQAKSGDLMVIDEPESNLHPEAQTRITEVIAEMVNGGLWVIITTHSPFILEHINNLMKAYVVASMSEETRELVLDVIRNENALLNPEKVGVYLFTKEGIIEDIKRDYIIDAESFRKVSDELGAKFTELLLIEDLYKKLIGESDDSSV
ncbi:hypothetical protein Asulf_01526 [Archaeoglobus sulfaticallidus PM70-1]|uniref:Endonuclease GajA/Old nuclease/RecF-like AAA domain-containing protein n=1 Tax=Archaeoglobus sulfaticallidus PM70-1 TaxID=387631 RepID=N0BD34_9EURY|nr:AAA family ATPase [Archaeoglobus sulfaticallidus]AGK61504.1 hypothetical protein Asulf_01526 [Archaeoglobus sulfaticallidus PM70-1]